MVLITCILFSIAAVTVALLFSACGGPSSDAVGCRIALIDASTPQGGTCSCDRSDSARTSVACGPSTFTFGGVVCCADSNWPTSGSCSCEVYGCADSSTGGCEWTRAWRDFRWRERTISCGMPLRSQVWSLMRKRGVAGHPATRAKRAARAHARYAGVHRRTPLVFAALLALPPNLAVRTRNDVSRRQIAVLRRVPFSRGLGPPNREGIGDRNLPVTTARTARTPVPAIRRRSAPHMVRASATFPPDGYRAVITHVARPKSPVSRWVPLSRELRVNGDRPHDVPNLTSARRQRNRSRLRLGSLQSNRGSHDSKRMASSCGTSIRSNGEHSSVRPKWSAATGRVRVPALVFEFRLLVRGLRACGPELHI